GTPETAAGALQPPSRRAAAAARGDYRRRPQIDARRRLPAIRQDWRRIVLAAADRLACVADIRREPVLGERLDRRLPREPRRAAGRRGTRTRAAWRSLVFPGRAGGA